MTTRSLRQHEIFFGIETETEILCTENHKADLSTARPAVYVGTWRKYNAGDLSGEWIDPTTFYDYREFMEFCRELHSDERAPEIMIQDWQHLGRDLHGDMMSEKDFNFIQKYAELLEQYGIDALEDFLEYFDDDDIESFEERYAGKHENDASFAISIFEERGEADKLEGICPWIDWNGIAGNMLAHDFCRGINGHYFYRD
ncbi:MAG: antirestriction protein ArdA [Muribaculaceae bacterium]|nr:antirestriction protein ArdA [Muribaculaceae bacterium]